jgi:hypothetical protein
VPVTGNEKFVQRPESNLTPKGHRTEGRSAAPILTAFRHSSTSLRGNVKMSPDPTLTAADSADAPEHPHLFKNAESRKGSPIRWSTGISKLCR